MWFYEGRHARTYTTTKHITTLLLRSRVKNGLCVRSKTALFGEMLHKTHNKKPFCEMLETLCTICVRISFVVLWVLHSYSLVECNRLNTTQNAQQKTFSQNAAISLQTIVLRQFHHVSFLFVNGSVIGYGGTRPAICCWSVSI